MTEKPKPRVRKLSPQQRSLLGRIKALEGGSGNLADLDTCYLGRTGWAALYNTIRSLHRAGLVELQGYSFEITAAGKKVGL